MAKSTKKTADITPEIIKGIEDVKGFDIIEMNLSKLDNAVVDKFIICSGNSSTQVDAIADTIIEEVRKKHNIKPWRKEGFLNKEWILIDFVDIVVHVFQPHIREFYNIEELWADAKMKRYENALDSSN